MDYRAKHEVAHLRESELLVAYMNRKRLEFGGGGGRTFRELLAPVEVLADTTKLFGGERDRAVRVGTTDLPQSRIE